MPIWLLDYSAVLVSSNKSTKERQGSISSVIVQFLRTIDH